MGTTKVLAFKTRKQQQAAKKRGQIDGYFGRIAKGQPVTKTPKLNENLPMNKTKQEVVKSGKKSSGSGYGNWNLPENWHTLTAQTLWHIRSRNADHDENN